MSDKEAKHVVVVGAGIVGVSTAIWLQRAGLSVTLIDKEGPAAGTSYGNGGVLAACSVVPVTMPGILKNAPKMLFSRDGPLFLKWSYLPKLLPWLFKYLGHANIKDVARIAKSLGYLLHDTMEQHQALAAGTPAEKYLAPSDYVFVYRDRAAFEGDALGWKLRRDNGFEWDEMEEAEFREYDPAFGPQNAFAVRLKNHGFIRDPGAYVQALADHFIAEGGALRTGEVTEIRQQNGRVSSVVAVGEDIECDSVVLSTGVWSGPLAKQLGVAVPMESERGYHIELVNPSIMPRSPVMVASGKFVATPMNGRLRCAGIVEFGGLDAPPSDAPFELLERQINKTIPGLSYDRVDRWMGHRPAPIDSIPIIGEAKDVSGAFMGYGHHHIGLTGGPKTGRILASLVRGERINADLTEFKPNRG
ncbi:MAG: FAD-dependent oxidoreductase [Pseudomonadota bacterium]